MQGITRREFVKGLGAGALWLGLGARFASAREDDFFTLVALPDTQYYSESFPHIYKAQTEWIARMKDEMRIAFVLHEGDITNLNTEQQWRNADAAMQVLDGVVPYGVTTGNHDMSVLGSARSRDTKHYNKYFPVERFSKHATWGGNFGETNESSWHTFSACGMDFLAVFLEFGPRGEVLDWANDVVAKHKGRHAIVCTHCYMSVDDTRVQNCPASPHSYGCGGADGEEIWQKFVRHHPNIFLVLSGHLLDRGTGRREDPADDKHTVQQVLANYQMKPHGGDGWMRVMKFLPSKGRAEFRTWSPYLNAFKDDEQNHFDLTTDMG